MLPGYTKTTKRQIDDILFCRLTNLINPEGY
jgi:hypothetical protein